MSVSVLDDSAFRDLQAKFERSQDLTHQMFLANYGEPVPVMKEVQQLELALKINAEYAVVKNLAPPSRTPAVPKLVASSSSTSIVEAKDETDLDSSSSATSSSSSSSASSSSSTALSSAHVPSAISEMIDNLPQTNTEEKDSISGALTTYRGGVLDHLNPHTQLLLRQRERLRAQPKWHAPWKHKTLISGHIGWVRTAVVDPANEWFATGSADRTIKIWDLASGQLKLTLTGHISSVRALAISSRHPYLFSVSEDKTVKCWDLEYNKVVRSYHGHLSGVYSCNLHPTIDLLFTGGRDSTCRVWDIRTKAQIKVLAGHTNTVSSIQSQPVDPQVITGSHDSTIRCWDLIAGKASSILTNHKKSVRAVGIHPSEYTFYSASADNIKVWKCPEGSFMRNISGHNTIINSVAMNSDNVLVSGGDNGTLYFWDWKTGYNFQQVTGVAQPGSLDSENGILSMTFDMTGSRLITCEADKSIKIYAEDTEATEETHPINFKPSTKRKRY